MTDATIIATIRKNASESVVVSLAEFKGYHLVDARVHSVFNPGDDPKPTKKGVALRVEKLPELIEALKDAEAEARRRGLIGGEA